MQFISAVVLFTLALGGAEADDGLTVPVARVVGLLRSLQTTIETQGVEAQQSYDKFACWVEDTTKRKNVDIATGESEIKRLSEFILKLSGNIGANTAAVQNLEVDIKDNEELQEEAAQTRERDHEAYVAESTETEQSVGALKAAIAVLSGTGTGAGGFLQQAQVMSVVGRIRAVIAQPLALQKLSDEQLQQLRNFVEHPVGLSNSRRATVSALQAGEQNNPFGDYAPHSDVILGTLKEMLVSFRTDLLSLSDKEKAAQTEYEAMSYTKAEELDTLKHTLETTKVHLAEDKSTHAESQEARDAAKSDLKEDKAYLAQLKIDSAAQSQRHSNSARLHALELLAIEDAISILTSPRALEVFRNATRPKGFFFMQVSQTSALKSEQQIELARQQTYGKLKALASQLGSKRIARIAAKLAVTGHFDDVIKSCQDMLEILRAEEKADIEHRDRCQSAQNANANAIVDLNHTISKVQSEAEYQENLAEQIGDDINELKRSMSDLVSDMETETKIRNKEHADFQQAVLDDTNMIQLLEQAIARIAKYYKDNQIPLDFVQIHHREEPVYTVDEDELPGVKVKDSAANVHATSNIISILSLIKEDTVKELKTGRADEAQAQSSFEKSREAMQASMAAKKAKLAILLKQQANANSMATAAVQKEEMKTNDRNAQTDLKDALSFSCKWVESHFDSRADKRKKEMEGITEAIAFLSGI